MTRWNHCLLLLALAVPCLAGSLTALPLSGAQHWLLVLALGTMFIAEAKIRSFEGLWLTSGLVMVIGAGLSLIFTGLFASVLR